MRELDECNDAVGEMLDACRGLMGSLDGDAVHCLERRMQDLLRTWIGVRDVVVRLEHAYTKLIQGPE
jgi:hypothetical protein